MSRPPHGGLKRLIRPTRGFQSMKTAYATIKGFEIMRMIRRRHPDRTRGHRRSALRQETLRSRRLIPAKEQARSYPTAINATQPVVECDNLTS
jgi:DDE superfamily endonuclease